MPDWIKEAIRRARDGDPDAARLVLRVFLTGAPSGVVNQLVLQYLSDCFRMILDADADTNILLGKRKPHRPPLTDDEKVDRIADVMRLKLAGTHTEKEAIAAVAAKWDVHFKTIDAAWDDKDLHVAARRRIGLEKYHLPPFFSSSWSYSRIFVRSCAGFDLPQRTELQMTDNSLTIDEFCEAERISRGTFYNLVKAGKAPTFFKVGALTRISAEARLAWRREREAEAAARLVPTAALAACQGRAGHDALPPGEGHRGEPATPSHSARKVAGGPCWARLPKSGDQMRDLRSSMS